MRQRRTFKVIKDTVVPFCVLAILLSGCKGSKTTATDHNNPLRRKPIVEVAEPQLEKEAQLIVAAIDQENEKEASAKSIYRKLLADDPSYAVAHYQMSRLMSKRHDLDSALLHAQAAVKNGGGNVWYLHHLADIYEMRGDGAGLTETWERIVSLQPDDIDNYYDLSNAYLKADNIEKAITTLDRVEAIVGVTEPVSLQKQRLWEAMGKEDKALKEVETLAEAMPQNMKYSAIMAECHMKQKDYGKAKKYYDQIATHHPDDEYIHISLANYYNLTGNPHKAIDELAIGFANPKLDCTSKTHILSSFFTTEEFYKTYAPETYHLLDTIVAHCDDTSAYDLFYGNVLMHQDRYAEAYPWFRRHLETDKSEYPVWEALLICESMMEGQDTQMLEDARQAAELFPLHILPYYLLGSHAYEAKDYETALKHLVKCEKIGFVNGYLEEPTYALLAECHYRTGNHDKAWSTFDKYLEKHPDDNGMLNNYAYYLSEVNERLEKAERMSRRTIEAEPDNATFLDTYAWILHQMHRDKEALPYMKKAVKNDKQDNGTLKKHLEVIEQATK